MATAPWTTFKDLVDGWIGDDKPTDQPLVEKWIARAERMVRREHPDLTGRLAADTEPDLPDTIRDVVEAMVTRVLRNPAGHRSVQGSETTGPFTGASTITFGGDNPGALEILKTEYNALRPPDATPADKITTVSLTGGTRSRHDVACSLVFGAVYCSCGADIAGRPIYGVDEDDA